MAAGFKSATVRAADVPATQTDMPSYVDLARIGITTLAEAQSVRVYADSAKTTEWAREIVSLTEMHVKVPSLTSTVVMYVDWDGVRADLAVGATYGRNAVWTDYKAVYHMNEEPTSATAIKDSTGSFDSTGIVGSMTSGDQVTGKLGGAIDFDGTDDGLEFPQVWDGVGDVTMQAWFSTTDAGGTGNITNQRANAAGTQPFILSVLRKTTANKTNWIQRGTSYTDTAGATTINTGSWFLTHLKRSGSTATIYINSSSDASATVNSTDIVETNSIMRIGTGFGTTQEVWNGKICEVRYRALALSANWITTECNNQNAESTFWGTWTTVSGGPAAQTARRGAVMMM